VAPETDETRAVDTRGASEPLWTGPSGAVEARVLAEGRQRAVPGGLRLDLIDPGTTTPTSEGRAETTLATPPIVSRAGWSADESLVRGPAEYIPKVEAVFVHHTAGTNDYTCADLRADVAGSSPVMFPHTAR
jgi:uncharacterized protein with LGFP repeats